MSTLINIIIPEMKYSKFNCYSLTCLLRSIGQVVPHNAKRAKVLELISKYDQEHNISAMDIYEQKYKTPFVNLKEKKRKLNETQEEQVQTVCCDGCNEWKIAPPDLDADKDWFCDGCGQEQKHSEENDDAEQEDDDALPKLPGVSWMYNNYEMMDYITWKNRYDRPPVFFNLGESFSNQKPSYFVLNGRNGCVDYVPEFTFSDKVVKCMVQHPLLRFYAVGTACGCQFKQEASSQVPEDEVGFYFIFDREKESAYVLSMLPEQVYIGNILVGQNQVHKLGNHEIIKYRTANYLFIKFYTK